MKFSKKFKKSDIICSDYFHSGKCMIVEEKNDSVYNCSDLLLPNQEWRALEFEYADRPYNWRLATDKDICYYLEQFIEVRVENIKGTEISSTEDMITIKEEPFGSVYLDLDQAAKLRDYLNKYVIGG